MPRLTLLALAALLTAAACGIGQYPGEKRRLGQCTELLTRLELASHTLPAAPPDLRFHAAVLRQDKYHPHGGIEVCYYAGLVPNTWTHTEVSPPDDTADPTQIWTAPASDRGRATLRYTLTSARRPSTIAPYLEAEEFAPMRARGQVERETSGLTANTRERRRVLVIRETEVLTLRMVRWSAAEDDAWYLRCEVELTGEYQAALPLFEAVCDAALVRHFEYSW